MKRRILPLLACLLLASLAPESPAHNLSGSHADFARSQTDTAVAAYLYLGARHMVTGPDHLLYLFGVLFFLHRTRDIVLYVTLFTLGHSTTLVAGVLAGWHTSAHLVDTVIGLSVVYKAFENLRGFDRLFGLSPDPRIAVLGFGLCHGLGLATRLQGVLVPGDGLVTNLFSFNLGVEIGQLAALAVMLLLLSCWRRSPVFERQAALSNYLLMTAGFTLSGYHLAGYLFA